MKRTFISLVLGMMLTLIVGFVAHATEPLNNRQPAINFHGRLIDTEGLSFDGSVTVGAIFNSSVPPAPGDPIYVEDFVNVQVERGTFTVPLLQGSAVQGTPSALVGEDEVFVDIKVDGALFLEGWPVNSQLAAVRAEYADEADGLRLPLSLEVSDIPQHSADLITTSQIDDALISSIPSAAISGQFPTDQIPDLDANIVTGDTFTNEAFAGGIQADWFTTGLLDSSLIPDEVMRSDEFGMMMGSVSHASAVPIPQGFFRSQCTWTVTVKQIYVSGNNGNDNNGSGIDHIQVVTDSNGVVTCLWDDTTGSGLPDRECSANFFTICRK